MDGNKSRMLIDKVYTEILTKTYRGTLSDAFLKFCSLLEKYPDKIGLQLFYDVLLKNKNNFSEIEKINIASAVVGKNEKFGSGVIIKSILKGDKKTAKKLLSLCESFALETLEKSDEYNDICDEILSEVKIFKKKSTKLTMFVKLGDLMSQYQQTLDKFR